MIIAPARVLNPSARVHTWGGSYTFHRVSEPLVGQIPAFTVDSPLVERKAA